MNTTTLSSGAKINWSSASTHTRVYDWLFDIPEMDLTSAFVLCRIKRYGDKSGIHFPGMDTLAKSCNLSKRQLVRVIQKLIDLGLVSKTRRGNGQTNEYHFLLHQALIDRMNDVEVSPGCAAVNTRSDKMSHQDRSDKMSPLSGHNGTSAASVSSYMKRQEEETRIFPGETADTNPNPEQTTVLEDSTSNDRREHSSLLRSVRKESRDDEERFQQSTNPETSTKLLTENAPKGRISFFDGAISDGNIQEIASFADFTGFVRRAKGVKAPSTSKQRLALEEAFDKAIAKDPMDADELESRFEAFSRWAENGKGKIEAIRFFSRSLTSWEPARISRQIDRSASVAEKRPATKPPVSAARPGAKLREIWNETCPTCPVDETIERNQGWQRWIESSELVDNFRQIATLAAECRGAGLGWMTLTWLMDKKDGNALWNWQRLLQGDFTPRKKGKPQTTVAQDNGDAIRKAIERGVEQEKERMVKLRAEWEKTNREREEDGLAPKPKPQKLVELESKYGKN